MYDLKEFVSAYWKHTKHTMDGLMLFVAVISVFAGIEIHFFRWIGAIVLFVVFFMASMRTWRHEHDANTKLHLRLKQLQDQKLTLQKLSAAQQDIVRTLANTESHSVVLFDVLGSYAPVFHGLETVASKYDHSQFRADIEDLERKGILKVDYVGMHNTPSYSPTSTLYALLGNSSNSQ